MAALLETPFSDLVNKPRDTVAALLGPHARSMLLRRRDAEDLVLTTAARHRQEYQVVSAATRLLVALVRHGVGQELLEGVMPEVFPWVRFLPDDEKRMFQGEFVETLQAVEELDNLSPVAQLIAEWRHTAEIHADPHLAAVLAQDSDDLGPVPEPRIAK